MESKVFNLIILDESGSMCSIKDQAINGVNETFQSIRCGQEDHPDQSYLVSLVLFDSNAIKTVYGCAPICKVKDIDYSTYRPNACTPLYDAMGKSLNELRPKVGKDDNVLVTIVTDGYENASREYDYNAIRALVTSLKNEGWTFTYMGAEHDVEGVAISLNIENHIKFSRNSESTKAVFDEMSNSRKEWFSKVNRMKSSGQRFNFNDGSFFSKRDVDKE